MSYAPPYRRTPPANSDGPPSKAEHIAHEAGDSATAAAPVANADRASALSLHFRDRDITPTVCMGADVLCYGDSLTAGYYCRGGVCHFAPYAEALARVLGQPCDHAGLSGWTASRMIAEAGSESCDAFGLRYPGLRRLLEAGGYFVVVLMAGTNDIGSFAMPNVVAENLRRLHEICHEAGAMTVAVTVPQSRSKSESSVSRGGFSLRKEQQRVNELLCQYALANSPQCLYVDMESLVPWEEGSPDWSDDGLHMSPSGYEKFGRLLGPLISEFVSSATGER